MHFYYLHFTVAAKLAQELQKHSIRNLSKVDILGLLMAFAWWDKQPGGVNLKALSLTSINVRFENKVVALMHFL